MNERLFPFSLTRKKMLQVSSLFNERKKELKSLNQTIIMSDFKQKQTNFRINR